MKHRLWTRLPAAVGLALTAAAADAQTPGPAARLRPPVPVTLPDSPLRTRSQTPDARPFDPTRGPTPPPQTQPETVMPAAAWPSSTYGSMSKTVIGTTRAPWDAPASPSVLESTWADVREFFTGGPADRVAAPRPSSPYTFAKPTAVPQTVPQPGATGIYAGPPAYRWYGWGTTTPGANPYAPGGQSPNGSGNWYAQTGATPGAFPVPVSVPRFAYGAESPAYVGGTNPIEPIVHPPARSGGTFDRGPIVTEQSTSPISVQPPTGSGVVPLTTIPVPPQGPGEPRPFDAPPTDPPPPIIPAGQPVPITVIPSGAVSEPVPADGVSWQRASGAVEPLPVVTAGEKRNFAPASVWSPARQLPVQPASGTVKISPVEAAVRGACQGSAAVTKFRVTGPNCLLVEVSAATRDDARAAFEKVSQHPLLKPYEVQFEVKITGR